MHEASPVQMLPLLAVILIGAKLAGRLSQRFGLPAVFGELLLGIVLGPSLLNVFHSSEPLRLLAEIGVILLMFRAGLETDLIQMKRVGTVATLVAVGGVVLPLGGGYLLGRYFGYDVLPSLFIGAVLTATSVSISAEVLRELGRIRSAVGATILGAAVIDDVLGVVVLSIVLGLAGEGNPWVKVGQMLLFIPIAWFVGNWLVRFLLKMEHHVGGREATLAVLIGMILIFAWAAEYLGSIAAITGAYLLGIVVARYTDEEHIIHHGSAAVGYALVVPVFFVNIGLVADARELMSAPVFSAVLLVIALLGKVVGCGLGALAGRFTPRESMQVGVGMIARGEVALVMVAAGSAAGLVDSTLFTATIVMTLVTTLVTPPLLRVMFGATTPVEEPVVATNPLP